MMLLSEVAQALDAQHIGEDVSVLSVGTDSRHIDDGQLFVAIKGDRFDGNVYAAEAIEKGAAAALVSDGNAQASPAILVDDTRLALGALAHHWRQKFSVPVVAVTGSNGKTTVKEMIAAILNASGAQVLATQGNLNNDIGMPLTLLNMRDAHTSAVIEMGMNHLGEIRYLTQIAAPQVAVVSNAGTAHIGELGSREAIAEAKGEIFEGLATDGIAVINADDDFAAYWQSLNAGREVIAFGLQQDADVSATYEVQQQTMRIELTTPTGQVAFNLDALGEHNVSNALAASAVAVALGIANDKIAQGLSQFRTVAGRLQAYAGHQDAVVIDDTYNANPDSMKAAIDVLINQQHDKEMDTVFVMGDMAELGADAETLHAEIGAYAKQQGVAQFLSLGDLSQAASRAFGQGQHFASLASLIETVKTTMHADTCVLVKGSRSMRMERVVDAIIKETKQGSAH